MTLIYNKSFNFSIQIWVVLFFVNIEFSESRNSGESQKHKTTTFNTQPDKTDNSQ